MFPEMQPSPLWEKAPATKWFEYCMYQAVAAAAMNPDAYIFTPKDEAWKEDSVWNRVEYPALTRNPFIQRIWQVDPRPWEMQGLPKDTCGLYEPKLIWDRSLGWPMPEQWFDCPFVEASPPAGP